MKKDATIVIRVPQKVKDKLTVIAKKEKIAMTALLDRYLSMLMEVPQETVASLLKSFNDAAESVKLLMKERNEMQADLVKVTAEMDDMSKKLIGGREAVKQAQREYKAMRDEYIDINAAITTATGALAADAYKQSVMT